MISRVDRLAVFPQDASLAAGVQKSDSMCRVQARPESTGGVSRVACICTPAKKSWVRSEEKKTPEKTKYDIDPACEKSENLEKDIVDETRMGWRCTHVFIGSRIVRHYS